MLSSHATSGRPVRQFLARAASAFGPFLIVLLILTGFSVWIYQSQDGPRRLRFFLSDKNLQLIAAHAMIVAATAVGMTLLMIGGGIDLSVGYVVSLVTVVTVKSYGMTSWDEPWASVAAVGLGLWTGVAFGAINGLVITRLRVLPFIATLGTLGMARGLARLLAGGVTVAFVKEGVFWPAWTEWFGTVEPNVAWALFGWGVWSVVGLALVAGVLLHRTVLGRWCYAIGANEEAARFSGVPVERTKFQLYLVAGLITGWAGILQTARLKHGSHDVQAGLELEVIAAVVIGGGSLSGGAGSIVGSILGAFLLGAIRSACLTLELAEDVRFIVVGAIVVAVGALNSWRQRRHR
jgi:ribose transport system permease protein